MINCESDTKLRAISRAMKSTPKPFWLRSSSVLSPEGQTDSALPVPRFCFISCKANSGNMHHSLLMWKVYCEHIVQIISQLWAGPSTHFFINIREIFLLSLWTFSLPLYYRHLFNTVIVFLSCYFFVQSSEAKLLVVNFECTICCCCIYISSNKYLALIFFSCVNT